MRKLEHFKLEHFSGEQKHNVQKPSADAAFDHQILVAGV